MEYLVEYAMVRKVNKDTVICTKEKARKALKKAIEISLKDKNVSAIAIYVADLKGDE